MVHSGSPLKTSTHPDLKLGDHGQKDEGLGEGVLRGEGEEG